MEYIRPKRRFSIYKLKEGLVSYTKLSYLFVKRSLPEIKDFVVIFSMVFGFGWLFVNAQLILIMIDNLSGSSEVKAGELQDATSKTVSISSSNMMNNVGNTKNSEDLEKLKMEILNKKINEKLKKINTVVKTDSIYKPKYDSYLKSNFSSYNISFDTLPPDGRLYIPKIGVDVHIVNLTNISMKTIEKADYDKYLYDGVVKYPYTPEPGSKGNVFLFGHTSYYWWKKNPYGTVFSKIPRLNHGDMMKVSWNGKMYEYKIFKKLILYPSQVDDVYKKYKNGEFLTIMGCYPIGSDKKRMVIIAKRVE